MKILKRALVTAVCVLTLPFLAASFAAGGDSIAGSGTTPDGDRVTINVRSDGNTAGGRIMVNDDDGHHSYDANCLWVSGTMAAVGGVDPDDGSSIWVALKDSPGGTGDRMRYLAEDRDCVPDLSAAPSLKGGNYRVTDG